MFTSCVLWYTFSFAICIYYLSLSIKKKEKRSPYAFSFLANGIMMPTN